MILSMKMLSVKVFSFRTLVSWMSDSDYSAAIDTDTHSVIDHYANASHYDNYQMDQEINIFFRFLSFINATNLNTQNNYCARIDKPQFSIPTI